jgi:hypothetical protein
VDGARVDQQVRFDQAGLYAFQITLTDPFGLTATSSVSVTMGQTLTSVAASPAIVTLSVGGPQQFSATANDQFGQPLVTQPSFAWTETPGSVGSVSATGLYTAPSSSSGTTSIQASAGGVTGTAVVSTVVAAPAAPTNLTAAAASSSSIQL